MMNEAFKHISLMTGGSHYPHVNPDLQQKFGELVIKECISIFAKRKDQAIDEGWNVDEAMSVAVEDIREHFGIE